MLALESDEAMREFGPSLRKVGPRLCYRCVSELDPPKSPYYTVNPKKKHLVKDMPPPVPTATFAPVRHPEQPDTDDEEPVVEDVKRLEPDVRRLEIAS